VFGAETEKGLTVKVHLYKHLRSKLQPEVLSYPYIQTGAARNYFSQNTLFHNCLAGDKSNIHRSNIAKPSISGNCFIISRNRADKREGVGV
jgi:hypothetical protein